MLFRSPEARPAPPSARPGPSPGRTRAFPTNLPNPGRPSGRDSLLAGKNSRGGVGRTLRSWRNSNSEKMSSRFRRLRPRLAPGNRAEGASRLPVSHPRRELLALVSCLSYDTAGPSVRPVPAWATANIGVPHGPVKNALSRRGDVSTNRIADGGPDGRPASRPTRVAGLIPLHRSSRGRLGRTRQPSRRPRVRLCRPGLAAVCR